jgi:uncharacterized membrane protein
MEREAMTDETRASDAAGPQPPIRVSRFQVATAVIMLVAGAVFYPSLPARIPQHWDAAGHIDRWASKSLLSAFFPVLIVVGMIVLAWALPRIDPLKASYSRFSRSYYLILDVIVAFLAFIYAITLYAAFDPQVRTGVLVPVGVGLMFAVLGNQLGKVKRNFFMGIRTPWTLASERVWTETHRIGARVFVACGLGMTLSAFLPSPYNYAVFFAIVLVAVVGTTGLSYFIYRRLEREGRLDTRFEGPRPA